MRYCGITVPLLTLRPEVCVLLLVRDYTWWTEEASKSSGEGRPPAFNWEWEANSWPDFLIELNDDYEPADCAKVHPTKMVPHAAAALYLAARVARHSR